LKRVFIGTMIAPMHIVAVAAMIHATLLGASTAIRSPLRTPICINSPPNAANPVGKVRE
jgi:hypothetical protein